MFFAHFMMLGLSRCPGNGMTGNIVNLKNHSFEMIQQQTGSSLLVKGGGYAGI